MEKVLTDSDLASLEDQALLAVEAGQNLWTVSLLKACTPEGFLGIVRELRELRAASRDVLDPSKALRPARARLKELLS